MIIYRKYAKDVKKNMSFYREKNFALFAVRNSFRNYSDHS